MAREFLTGDRNQSFLLPPDMRDWLAEDHLVWFVIDLVARLDLAGFAKPMTDPYQRGRRRYDPVVLVTVLVYAYCVGERSSRQIERRSAEDVAFRIAAADLRPDHSTLSRFMKDHAEAFDALFAQVLSTAATLGLGRVGTIVLDGTKMAADASPLAARTKEGIVAEGCRITDEARRTDAAEDAQFGDARGDELPADLVDPRSRGARLEEALAHIEAREAKDRGRRPSSRRRTKPIKANTTDPECRVMKGPHNYFPGYNAQAMASQDGLIVAADVTSDGTDNHQFTGMVDQSLANLEAADLAEPDHVVADSGYYTNSNVTAETSDEDTVEGSPPPERTRRPESFIPPSRDPRRQPIKTRGPIPRGATPAQVMERKLTTKRGSVIYETRARTIEPIFGQIKTVRGIDRFRRRGLAAARSEWRFIATTHNVLKMWRNTTLATSLAT